MERKMKYVKPDVYVERFRTNAYCNNCGYVNYDKAIDITCIINGTENIYSSNTKPGSTGCVNIVYNTYTVKEGGYVSDVHNVIRAVEGNSSIQFEANHIESGMGSQNHQSCTYIAEGTYLVWEEGGLTHMGLITPEIESEITQSS